MIVNLATNPLIRYVMITIYIKISCHMEVYIGPCPPPMTGVRLFLLPIQIVNAMYHPIIKRELHLEWRLGVKSFLGGVRNEITVDIRDYSTPNHFKNFFV